MNSHRQQQYFLIKKKIYLPQAQMHGEAVIRPLYYQFPTDLEARKIDDQFMWSDGIMVAPVLEQGALSRDVYFPQVK